MVNAYLVDTDETTLADVGMPNAVNDLRGELDEARYDQGTSIECSSPTSVSITSGRSHT